MLVTRRCGPFSPPSERSVIGSQRFTSPRVLPIARVIPFGLKAIAVVWVWLDTPRTLTPSFVFRIDMRPLLSSNAIELPSAPKTASVQAVPRVIVWSSRPDDNCHITTLDDWLRGSALL